MCRHWGLFLLLEETCKALAEFGIHLQVVPGCILCFVKGKGIEQKPSYYSYGTSDTCFLLPPHTLWGWKKC